MREITLQLTDEVQDSKELEMNIGKPLRTIHVPEREHSRPIPAPDWPQREAKPEAIPAPDWPKHEPAETGKEAE